jgi:hypothetical protein
MSRSFDLPSSGRALLLITLAVLFWVHMPLPLMGQNLTSTASISGIVADPADARIANAAVTISSPEKGISRTFKTDSSGTFSFSLLPPTVYSLRVEAPGFKTYEQGGITLEVGQAAGLSVVLLLGNVQERVQVSGEAPLLTTDNANIASEVSEKQIVELPLNFRSPIGLAFLDSSVRNMNQGYLGGGQDTADQDMSFLSFGGQPFATTGYLLDGASNGAMGWDGVIYVPSVDSVQEFKIQTNSFTAQYGLSAGNVMNIITKSGSSHYHGDVYEFFRNDALDANYFINDIQGEPKTPLHMNQFGISEGGPLYSPGIYKQRDRTFFFVLYEGLRLTGPVNFSTTTAPTSAFKSGDLSALLGAPLGTDALCRPIVAGAIYNPNTTRSVTATCPTANNIVGDTVQIRDPIAGNNLAGLIDPVAAKILPFFPDPTGPGLQGNFFKSQSAVTTSNEFTVRIDHNLTDLARLYGRFSRKWESKEQSPAFYGANNPAGTGQTNPNNRYSIALGYNQVLSSTFTASFNFGFQRWVEANSAQGFPFVPSTLGLPSALDSLAPIFPNIDVSGYTTLGLATEQAFSNNTGSVSADLVKVVGPHTLSFGYMGVLNQLNGGQIVPTAFSFNQGFTSGPDPNDPTSGTGDPFASFLLGTASDGSAPVTFFPQTSKRSHGWYLQDDWKATSRLTLNLGLRYDIQFAPIDKFNRQAYFDPNAVNPISALVGGTYRGALVYNDDSNRGNYRNDYKDFAPRIGFSYQVAKNIVARGGFAVFYPTAFLGNPASPGYSRTTSYVSSLNGGLNPSSVLSNPFPQGILQPIGNSLGSLTNVGQNVSALVYDRKSPYVEQWSFGLQFSPTSKDVVEVSYIGNHGVHLISSGGINLNQLSPDKLALGNAALTAVVPNPFFGQPAMDGSSCGLADATVPAFQLILPMPQYCNNVKSSKGSVGTSGYNALQARYTHRASNGLILSANYTYSKFLDDVPGAVGFVLDFPYTVRNSYDLGLERSVDAGDIPHAAVISLIYPLPFGKGKRFGSHFSGITDAILGGWQVSAINIFRQGIPIGIDGNLNPESTFGGNQHVNVVGDPNRPGPVAANPGCNAPSRVGVVQSWFNTCAFVAAAPGTFGNVPNYLPYLRSPGYADTDLGISKWFNPTEALRIQFRAEMFNALNHPNLGPPSVSLDSGSYGGIGLADIARQIQLGLKIYW